MRQLPSPFLRPLLALFAITSLSLTGHAQTQASLQWSVNAYDKLFASLSGTQTEVSVGDQRFKVSYLKAVRQSLALKLSGSSGLKPQASFDPNVAKWTNGILYYYYDNSVTDTIKQEFEKGIREWQKTVDLKFLYVQDPNNPPANYFTVHYTGTGGGSNSLVGMAGGQQIINIDEHADTDTVHELGHCLGMIHEQCRSDRDKYLIVHADGFSAGINPATNINFAIVPGSVNKGAYDYDSIMHYPTIDYNSGTKLQLEPRDPTWMDGVNPDIGQTGAGELSHLSTLDKLGMANVYGYSRPITGKISSSNGAITGMTLELADTGDGWVQDTVNRLDGTPGTPDGSGNFTFPGLPVTKDSGNITYKVIPHKAGFTFSPAFRLVNAGATNVNFVGTPNDQVPPTVSFDPVSSLQRNFNLIGGTAFDSNGSIASCQFTLEERDQNNAVIGNGRYWTGTAWVDGAPTALATTLTDGHWTTADGTLPAPASLTSGHYFRFVTTVKDQALNTASANLTVQLDAVDPAVSFTSNNDGDVVFGFDKVQGLASDNFGAPTVTFSILDTSSGDVQYWNGSTFILDGNDPLTNLPAVVSNGTWKPAPGVIFPTRGQTHPGSYQVTAIATDAAGNSTMKTILVTRSPFDSTVPNIGITSPQITDQNSLSYVTKVPAIPTITGTSGDPESGVAGVVIYLIRFTHPAEGDTIIEYWNGTAWTENSIPLATNFDASTGNWSAPTNGYSFPPTNQLKNSTYQVQAYAWNNEVQTGAQLVSVNVKVDRDPPTVVIASPADGTTYTKDSPPPAANWFNGSATVPYGTLGPVTLYLKRLNDNYYWNGAYWTNTLTALSGTASGSSWTTHRPLPDLGEDSSHCFTSGSYDFIAIAQDDAGNTGQKDSFVNVDYHIDYPTLPINPTQLPAISGSSVSYNSQVFQFPLLPQDDTRSQTVKFARTVSGGGYVTGVDLRPPYSQGSYQYPTAAIQKLDASGNTVWRRERVLSTVTTGTGADAVTTYYENWGDGAFAIDPADNGYSLELAGMDTDANGNIFAAFNMIGQVYGITSVNSGGQIFYGLVPAYIGESTVVKFNASGALQGRWIMKGADYDNGSGVVDIKAVGDGSCAVLVSNFNSDASSLYSYTVYPQSVLARFGSAHDYVKHYGADPAIGFDEQSTPENLGVDAAGNVYFSSTDAETDVETNSTINRRHEIRKFDSSGNLTGEFSGDICTYPETWDGMSVDAASGAVYTGGALQVSNDDHRLVVNRFDLNQPAGSQEVWRTYSPALGSTSGFHMVLSPGGITVGSTLTSGGYNWLVCRFAYDGSLQWCRTYSDPDHAASFGIILGNILVDNSDNVYIWGTGSTALVGKIAGNGDMQFLKPLDATYDANSNVPFLLLPDGGIGSFQNYSSGNTFPVKFLEVGNPADVLLPIDISSGQPTGATLPAGATITLSVSNSGSPATYQWRKEDSNGTPQNINGATSATLVIGNAKTTDSGNYSVVLKGIGNPANVVTSNTAQVQIFTPVPLGDALDNHTQTFTSNGAPWLGQNIVTHNGQSTAAVFAAYPQSSTLQTTVVGPGIVKFYAKSSNGYLDDYEVQLDGVYYAGCNNTDWTQGYVEIPAGAHTVTWYYSPQYQGNGTAYLDQVTFGPEQPVAIPAGQPADQDVSVGDFVILSVIATGDAPQYQWYDANGPLDGETQSSLYFFDFAQANEGDYHVVVSNMVSTGTSRVASIAVFDPNIPDTAAPKLTSLSVSPSTVDVTGTSATVTIDFNITDDGTGLKSGNLAFKQGTTTYIRNFGSGNRIAGTGTNGTYEFQINVPRGTAPATWQVTSINMTDRASTPHTATYSASQLPFPAGSTTSVVIANSNVDVSAPVLVSTLGPVDSFDVTSGSKSFPVTFHITDDASGLDYGYATFTSPSGHQGSAYFYSYNVASGDDLDGTYSIQFTIPAHAEPGVWTLSSLTLYDNLANVVTYSNPAGAGQTPFPAGTPVQVTIVNTTPDNTGPQLVTATGSNATINVTGTSQAATLTLHVTDDVSGFDYGAATLVSPSGKQQASNYFYGDGLDVTAQTQITVPQFAEPGVWTLSRVTLYDQDGNSTDYATDPTGDQVAFPAGTAAQITVQDTAPDNKGPSLEGLTYTPTTVDVSAGAQAVTLTAHLTDVASGVDYASGYFYSTQGSYSGSIYFTVQNRISGTAKDGMYQTSVNIPQGADAGIWSLSLGVHDLTGNSVVYSVAGSDGTVKFPAKTTSGKPAGTLKVLDGADALEFAMTGYTVDQGEKKAVITVSRVNAGTGTAKVNFATHPLGSGSGSAVAGVDYTAAAGSLTFKATDTSKSFTVPIKNSGAPGPDKSLSLVLSNATGSSLGSPATATLTIVNPYSVLNVTVNQQNGGTVSKGFFGQSSRVDGNTYKIIAKPAKGYLFDHWVGGVDITAADRLNPTLTFPVFGDTNLQAVFVLNRFPGVKGTYSGVILSTGSANTGTGFATITTTATPAFTGAVTIAGLKIPIAKVAFRPDGSFTHTLSVLGQNLTLHLQLDLTPEPGGTGRVTGSLLAGTAPLAAFTADKAPTYKKHVSASETGTYTLVLPAAGLTSGSATLTVPVNGHAKITCTLPDGTGFMQAATVAHGIFPVYASLYSGAGSLAGNLVFNSGSKTWSGTLLWLKPAAAPVTIQVQ